METWKLKQMDEILGNKRNVFILEQGLKVTIAIKGK